MKIPDSIRIGGVEYAIQESEGVIRSGNSLLVGEINFDECTITLSSVDGRSHQRRCITLLHEITHGIFETSSAHFDDEMEEKVCELMSKGFYQVLQDNAGRLFDLVNVDGCEIKRGECNG